MNFSTVERALIRRAMPEPFANRLLGRPPAPETDAAGDPDDALAHLPAFHLDEDDLEGATAGPARLAAVLMLASALSSLRRLDRLVAAGRISLVVPHDAAWDEAIADLVASIERPTARPKDADDIDRTYFPMKRPKLLVLAPHDWISSKRTQEKNRKRELASAAFAFGTPVAIVGSAPTDIVPDEAVSLADETIRLKPLTTRQLRRVIEIVTGGALRGALPSHLAAHVTPEHLALAVRPSVSAGKAVKDLARLVSPPERRPETRCRRRSRISTACRSSWSGRAR